MSAVETPKRLVFFARQKVSSEEKIKVFGKSAVAFH